MTKFFVSALFVLTFISQISASAVGFEHEITQPRDVAARNTICEDLPPELMLYLLQFVDNTEDRTALAQSSMAMARYVYDPHLMRKLGKTLLFKSQAGLDGFRNYILHLNNHPITLKLGETILAPTELLALPVQVTQLQIADSRVYSGVEDSALTRVRGIFCKAPDLGPGSFGILSDSFDLTQFHYFSPWHLHLEPFRLPRMISSNLQTLTLCNITTLDDDNLIAMLDFFPNLEELTLQHSHALTDAAILVVAQMPKLRKLHILDGSLTDLSVDYLCQYAPYLTDLSLESVGQLTPSCFEDLGAMTQLEALCIRARFKYSNLPAVLSGYTHLHTLDLDSPYNIYLQSAVDSDRVCLQGIGRLTSLTSLNLNNWNFDDGLALELAPLTNLTTLNISSAMLFDPAYDLFDSLTNISTLKLYASEPTEGSLNKLTQLPALKNLFYRASRDIHLPYIFPSLSKLTQLRSLHTHRIRVVDTDVEALLNLTNLTTLNLMGCLKFLTKDDFDSLPYLENFRSDFV